VTPFPLLLLGLLGAEQDLDTFRFADVQAARRAWVSAEAAPPVELAKDDGRTVLAVAAPFAADAKLPRAVIDRRVALDLSAVGAFSLEIAADSAEAGAHLSLYFRSGDGWYAGSGSLVKKGWQTVRFSKAGFRTEGTPAGWQKIDGVRIAVWRGAPKDTTLLIRRLAAVTHEVALVVPAAATHRGDPEYRAAMDSAALVAGMLEELGLGSDAIEDAALAHGALGKRRVVILAHNPGVSNEAVAVLEKFVEGGGKVFVCYSLPERLGRALGFGNAKYVRPQRPGQFAEIRFEASDIPGLPQKVAQASWNITAAEPDGHNARVIGRWFDDAGKPAGHAAMLLSDRGAFFSHVILGDDRARKQQMLAAVLGKFEPSLWRAMARAAIDRAGCVGHCGTVEEVRKYVENEKDLSAGTVAAEKMKKALAWGEIWLSMAGLQFDADGFAGACDNARRAHSALVEVYLEAQPSPKREGRAVWNHSGTGAYPGDWDRSAKELAAAGINMIQPNMLWGGLAHYPSDILPRSDTFRQYGDQVEQCVAAAKKHGLQVHVWKVNYNLSNAPKDFVEKMRRAGRTQVTAGGQPQNWLCPSHPENQKLELESMLEVARKYAVAGLHFDYIRYPGRECCYCEGCRGRFEAESGRKVSNWPRDCYSGPRRDEYNDWRCKQITTLVAAVHREGKKLRPQLKISAAVFGSYPGCRDSVAQDWPAWIKAGYLDYVCPMDYTTSDTEFRALVENQLKLVGGRIPVYPGIGATASSSTLSADRVVGQIHIARSLGAAGFTIFNFDRGTVQSIIPGVGLGAGAQRAVPPHQ
jgi:uncharacterized lipoprotein YddW (UPF0748 family)